MKVGVLALQGDFAAHARALRRAGAEPVEVRTVADLDAVDALVLPGGESTTIRRVAREYGLLGALREQAGTRLPIFGTCAGLIVCAREIVGGEEPIAPVVDVAVERNAYGRQVDSFETDLEFSGLGTVRAVFIRAPKIVRVGPNVQVLAEHRGAPVAVREGNVLLVSFHPELTEDDRIHRLFVELLAAGALGVRSDGA